MVKLGKDLSKAARKAAFDECAKLAEDQALAWINGDASTAIGHAYQNACRTIAARIRSLAGEALKP